MFLIVLPGSNVQGGVRAGFGNVNTLLDSDARAMARELRSVAFVSPVLRRQEQVVAGNLNWGTLAQGVAPEFQQIRDWQSGRGPFSSRGRHGQRRQSRRHRPNRGAPAVRQRRCSRRGHPHPKHPVPCGRRPRRAKDRRDRARIKTIPIMIPVHDHAEAAHAYHLGAEHRRQGRERRTGRRSPGADYFAAAPAPPHRSGARRRFQRAQSFRYCRGGHDHGPGHGRACSAASRRFLCSSAASAS